MAPKTSDGQPDPMPATVAPVIPVDPRQAAFAFAATKGIADKAAALLKTMRTNADLAFERKDRISVKDPADRARSLATVSYTDPSPIATITDPTELRDWYLEHYDELCEDVDQLVPGVSTRKLIAALREHAPQHVVDQLVTTDRVVPDHELNALRTRSAGVGHPIGPGGEIDEKAPPGIVVEDVAPTVQVRLAKGAVERFVELWQAGSIDPFTAPAQLRGGDPDSDADTHAVVDA